MCTGGGQWEERSPSSAPKLAPVPALLQLGLGRLAEQPFHSLLPAAQNRAEGDASGGYSVFILPGTPSFPPPQTHKEGRCKTLELPEAKQTGINSP